MSTQKGSLIAISGPGQGPVYNSSGVLGNITTAETVITRTDNASIGDVAFLKNDGDFMTFEAHGLFSNASPTALKTLKLYCQSGGNVQAFVLSNAISVASTGSWKLSAKITRTDNEDAIIVYEFVLSVNNLFTVASVVRTGVALASDFNVNSINIYLTGQASGASAGSAQITCDDLDWFKWKSAIVPIIYDN